MIRLFFFFVGFCFLVVGATDFILYLNLFTMGYSLKEFVRFVLLGYPGILLSLGLVFVLLAIFKRKKGKNEYRI